MSSVKSQSCSEDCRIKTTCFHIRTGNRKRRVGGIWVLQLLEVVIEEQLALQDRSADSPAEIVEPLLCFGASPVEIASRIQVVVLEIFIKRAVKPVGPALADDVEDRTAAAVLRRGVRCNHVHLGYRLALALVNVGAMR